MRLGNYINLILELEDSSILSSDEICSINGFDESILILDDIEDQSQVRDGHPCFYIINGVDKAKKESLQLRKKAFTELDEICKKRNLGIIRRFRIKLLLKKLHRDIQIGQELDKLLQSEKIFSDKLFSIYNRMVCLFTGGHIKYAFLIGFILSGKKIPYKNQVASVGENIGILRQIDDDIKDYSEYHHEVLGDLIHHKKRLPELLFYLYATEDEKNRLELLLSNSKNNYNQIKKAIFNDRVLNTLNMKIVNIRKKINEQLSILPEKYQNRLNELQSKFIPDLKNF